MKNLADRFLVKKAFTLVEIMLVVLVIALLAAIAIPNMLRARQMAHESSAQATLKSIANALETYAASNSQYPLVTTSLIGVTPPYLSKDFFTGTHNGYVFAASLTVATYNVTAIPASSGGGTTSYTISTGGLLVQNP